MAASAIECEITQLNYTTRQLINDQIKNVLIMRKYLKGEYLANIMI